MQRPLWFWLIAAGQLTLALVLLAASAGAAGKPGPGAALAALIGLGLAIDNAVVAAGAPLLARAHLPSLSRLRYLLHALVTPLLLPLALLVAAHGGLAAAGALLPLGWGLALAWIAAAWGVGYRNLELELVRVGSLVRHHNASRKGQPWLRLLLVAVVLVIVALASQVPQPRVGTPMLAGGLAMLLGAPLARRLGLVVANGGELLLMAGLGGALLG
jgi:hypothetical protein